MCCLRAHAAHPFMHLRSMPSRGRISTPVRHEALKPCTLRTLSHLRLPKPIICDPWVRVNEHASHKLCPSEQDPTRSWIAFTSACGAFGQQNQTAQHRAPAHKPLFSTWQSPPIFLLRTKRSETPSEKRREQLCEQKLRKTKRTHSVAKTVAKHCCEKLGSYAKLVFVLERFS